MGEFSVAEIVDILTNLAVVEALHDIPSVDSTDNVYMRDAIGDKEDAAVGTVGSTASAIAYLKGILTDTGTTIPALHLVPTTDSTDDVHMRDGIGAKDDGVKQIIGTTHSLMRLLKGAVTALVDASVGVISWPASAAPAHGVTIAAVIGEIYDLILTISGAYGTEAKQDLILADIGDASGATLGSILGILGNPATTITAQIAAVSAGDATEAKQDLLLADVGNASGSILGSILGILGNPASTITAQIAALGAGFPSAATQGSHNITTGNDKTETDIVEVNLGYIFDITISLDLDALTSASEGGIVKTRGYRKPDGSNYPDLPHIEVDHVVDSSPEYPSIRLFDVHNICKFTIECSDDVTGTRAVPYTYVTKQSGA